MAERLAFCFLFAAPLIRRRFFLLTLRCNIKLKTMPKVKIVKPTRLKDKSKKGSTFYPVGTIQDFPKATADKLIKSEHAISEDDAKELDAKRLKAIKAKHAKQNPPPAKAKDAKPKTENKNGAPKATEKK